jgi:hypothetical protein
MTPDQDKKPQGDGGRESPEEQDPHYPREEDFTLDEAVDPETPSTEHFPDDDLFSVQEVCDS